MWFYANRQISWSENKPINEQQQQQQQQQQSSAIICIHVMQNYENYTNGFKLHRSEIYNWDWNVYTLWAIKRCHCVFDWRFLSDCNAFCTSGNRRIKSPQFTYFMEWQHHNCVTLHVTKLKLGPLEPHWPSISLPQNNLPLKMADNGLR